MAIKFQSFRGTGGGAVTGGLVYKGSYDAATNNPVLTSAKKGNFYIVSVAGTLAGVSLNVGDHIVFNQDASTPITSAMFDVIDNTDAVASVNGQTGVVVLDTDDVSEGATNQYYTNARADARIAAATANDLSDVSYTAGAGIDGYVMTYNNTSGNWEAQVSASAPVTSVNTQTGAVVLDTDDVAEGVTNLYYTNARFDTQLATKDTDDVAEGATNLYYTNARADARIAAATANDLSDVSYTAGAGIDGYVMTYNNTSGNWEAQVSASAPVTSVNTQTGAVVLDTDDVSEGATNLYYTNARADARIAAATANDLSDVSYTAGAGIDGYVMTYNNTSGNWEAQISASAPVTSVNTQTGAVVLDTDDVAEGVSNLYYTNARFDTQLATKDTDDVSEGATNLYYTNARADARIAAATANDLSDVSYTAGAGIDGYVMTYNNTSGNWEAQVSASAPVTSVNTQTGAVVLDTDDVSEGATNLYYTNARFDTQLATKTTDNLTEGSTNLYYTNARADARIAAATANDLSDVSYTAGAGIDGYVLTYNNTSGNWEAQAASGGGGGFTYSAITSASSPVSGAASTHYSADTSGGAITINLPALSGVTAGTEIRVKLKTAGNTLTLDGNSTETIDGSTTYTLTVQNQAVTLVSDGSSNWEVI